MSTVIKRKRPKPKRKSTSLYLSSELIARLDRTFPDFEYESRSELAEHLMRWALDEHERQEKEARGEAAEPSPEPVRGGGSN